MLTTSLNVLAAFVIFVWALWCVFNRGVNDGVFGKVFYFFAALAAFAVLVGNDRATATIDPSDAMNWAMAMLGLRQMMMRYVWPILRRYLIGCDTCQNRRAGDL